MAKRDGLAWMESALITSPLNRCASSMANFDFPTPVHPRTATTGGGGLALGPCPASPIMPAGTDAAYRLDRQWLRTRRGQQLGPSPAHNRPRKSTSTELRRAGRRAVRICGTIAVVPPMPSRERASGDLCGVVTIGWDGHDHGNRTSPATECKANNGESRQYLGQQGSLVAGLSCCMALWRQGTLAAG